MRKCFRWERIKAQAEGALQGVSFRRTVRIDIPLECQEAEHLIGSATMTKDDFEVNIWIHADRISCCIFAKYNRFSVVDIDHRTFNHFGVNQVLINWADCKWNHLANILSERFSV